MAGIHKCKDLVLKGLCENRKSLECNIWQDPWVPILENHMISEPGNNPTSTSLDRELVDQDTRSQNLEKFEIFSKNIVSKVLKIKIPVLEYDSPVLFPSTSWQFSSRSEYKVQNQGDFQGSSQEQRTIWRRLWQSKLHDRQNNLSGKF